ncbi:hypothetical protein EPN52_14790 [bacterium]|nr:MAG: hypothetical protein EPN52_14790 [bacterium]
MSAHTLAGWATVAVVVIVAIVLSAYAAALALRARRLTRRLDHPLLVRIREASVQLRALEGARTKFEGLAKRAAEAGTVLAHTSAERERLRREGGQAVSSIFRDLRSIRDLLS